jgi:hypothetical protein
MTPRHDLRVLALGTVAGRVLTLTPVNRMRLLADPDGQAEPGST